MSQQVISGRPVWIGEFEFSNRLQVAAIDHGADDHRVTTLNDTGHRHQPGTMKSTGFGLEGFWDASDGADSIDKQMFDNIAVADKPVSIAAMNGLDGEIAYLMKTIEGEYQHGGAVGDPHGFSSGGGTTEDLVRGTILGVGNKTVTDTGTERQLGAASSAQRIFAALHVTAFGGTSPTLDVILQSDVTGFASPADRITFSQATGKTSEYLILDGPITDDYWRISYTIGGTGSPNFAFMIVVGIQ